MKLIDTDAAIEAVCEEVMDRFFVPPSVGYDVAEEALKKLPSIQPETNCSEFPNNSDTISRQAAIDKFIDALEEIFSDIRERHVDDSVCGLCEYDGAYIGQSGDWCNECPGFDRDDCFKLSDKIRKEWTDEIIKALPSAQPERKKGSWTDDASCPFCGFKPWYERDIHTLSFCPSCGADNRGKTE